MKHKGLCKKHYVRQWKYGDPRTVKQPRDREEMFELNTAVVTEVACVIWTGLRTEKGYGLMRSIYGTRAHTYGWGRVNGAVPKGLLLDHFKGCDTACCNPDHLRLATRSENGSHRIGLSANNTSGYRGVVWVERLNKWLARCNKNGKQYYGGIYDDKELANEAATRLRKEVFGEFAGIE